MELYTLDDKLNKNELIEDYESAIWTERFIEAGDAKITVPATRANIKKLAMNTVVRLVGSSEGILIETQQLEEGMLTVTGPTLEAFFKNRWIDIYSPYSDEAQSSIYNAPDYIMRHLVAGNASRNANVGAIRALRPTTYGEILTNVTESIHATNLYEEIHRLALKYQLGMALKLRLPNGAPY